VYEGGTKALRAFLEQNVQYPPAARESGREGDVHIRYDVDESGRVIHAQVLRGIGGGCDEEALRVVRLLQFKPVRNRGHRVTQHFDIVLHFRLPQLLSDTRVEADADADTDTEETTTDLRHASTKEAFTATTNQKGESVRLLYTYVPASTVTER
jgi:TonB family protein